jgi:mRNA-degrading endonuclease toxin of MazEF toxin-antitoxin module
MCQHVPRGVWLDPRCDRNLPTPRLSVELPLKRSWVKISQIRTLAVERIGQRLNQATPEEIGKVIKGHNEIIGT